MSTEEGNLLTRVRVTNEHGLGYTPESEWENEILQVMAKEGDVILISSHDGYR